MDWTGRTSLLVLPSRRGRKGNTQLMIASCTVMIGMGYRDTNRESLCGLLVPKTRTHGSTTLLPEKGPVPQAVRGVYASLQELSYLRVILNQNFQTQLIPCTSPVDDHASNRAAETVLAKEPSAQKGKRSSTCEIDNWLERSTMTKERSRE